MILCFNNNLLLSPETDPGMEGMLMGGPKADESPVAQNSEEPEDYDGDEQIMGEVDGDKQHQSKQPENIGAHFQP